MMITRISELAQCWPLRVGGASLGDAASRPDDQDQGRPAVPWCFRDSPIPFPLRAIYPCSVYPGNRLGTRRINVLSGAGTMGFRLRKCVIRSFFPRTRELDPAAANRWVTNEPLGSLRVFRMPAVRGRGRIHGGRRPKSLEGGNRGGVCAGGGVGLWGFNARRRLAWLFSNGNAG